MPKNSKRGLCIPWNFEPNDFSIYARAIDDETLTWLSNWEMWLPKGLPENITFVPQCRTAKEAPQITDYMKGYKGNEQVQGFLGFNEPDISSQASLRVDEAVQLWKDHVLPLKQNYPDLRIGSPAVSNGPDGIFWLHSFLQCLGGAENAGIDHICLHWYGPDVQEFKKYITAAHEAFRLPLSITEFACTRWDPNNCCTEDEVHSFLEKALEFLDSADFVERYAWFGAMADVGEAVGRSNCLQADGKLSRAGAMYCA